MTSSRFPVEVSVALGSRASRYSCELCPPELENSQRLLFAIGLLTELGLLEGVPSLVAEALRWHGAARSLRWGAWVSGRHDDHGDRFKLYIEVPSERRAVAVGAAYQWHGLDGLPGAPVMLGIDLAGGRCEWYVEPGRLDRDDVGRIAGSATLGLLDHLAEGRWYPKDTAFSIDVRPDTLPVVSVICGANRMVGRDAVVFDCLHAIAQHLGMKWHGYDALLAASTAASPHCLLAVSAEPEPAITVGICPA